MPIEIPCDENTHWRYLRLYLVLPDDGFQAGSFREALGPEWRSQEWRVTEGDNPAYFSWVELVDLAEKNVTPEEDPTDPEQEAGPPPRWIIQFDTIRRPPSVEESKEDVSGHQTVFDAIAASAGTDTLPYSAVVDLYFSSHGWRLRAPLFERPQSLEAVSAELGRVEVSGVSMRFHGQRPGLHEASLQVSPDDSQYFVRTSFTVAPTPLGDLFGSSLSKVEDYARLFVEEIKT